MNAPEVGSVVDHYRLDSVLGRGGTAVVYAATDTRLGRQVAVKVLSPDLAQDVQFRERFTRESRVAASIDHPHIVPLYEAGEWGGHLYIAMRLVDGTDLGTLVRREGRLDPARTVSITSQVASALDEAHHRGLIHRDVKPANVLVVPGQGPGGGDHAYLSDFGLTKPVSSQTQLTRAGLFVGTADYVAPEQIQGAAVDHRVDVYSLGCLVYECLTGRRPFERDNELAVMVAHVSEPAPQVMQTRPEAGFALSRVVARALAKSRDDRFATCGDLAAAARAALDDYVPCLVVRDGLLAGHSIRVDTEVLLGRDDTEHPLLDPAVSRRHALVRRDGRHLGITDLGSRNGTWVNGRRIVGQASLNPGDAVVVGATTIDVGADTRGRASATIALERPAPPAAAASPPPAAPLVWTPAAAAPPATAAASPEPDAGATSLFRPPPPPARRATLRVIGGPDSGRTFEVAEAVELGSAASAAVRVADRMVSRRHARVSVTAGGVVVEDLGSTNGTLVGGRRITDPVVVPDGGSFQIGLTFIEVASSPPADPSAAAS